VVLTVKKLNPKNVKYNLGGSGLIHVPDAVCKKDSCKPEPNATPKSPVPVRILKSELIPLVATKQGASTNKWELNGIVYKTFNSFWVNISRKQFTTLKSNG
jgi:hypothetical protein